MDICQVQTLKKRFSSCSSITDQTLEVVFEGFILTNVHISSLISPSSRMNFAWNICLSLSVFGDGKNHVISEQDIARILQLGCNGSAVFSKKHSFCLWSRTCRKKNNNFVLLPRSGTRFLVTGLPKNAPESSCPHCKPLVTQKSLTHIGRIKTLPNIWKANVTSVIITSVKCLKQIFKKKPNKQTKKTFLYSLVLFSYCYRLKQENQISSRLDSQTSRKVWNYLYNYDYCVCCKHGAMGWLGKSDDRPKGASIRIFRIYGK